MTMASDVFSSNIFYKMKRQQKILAQKDILLPFSLLSIKNHRFSFAVEIIQITPKARPRNDQMYRSL